MYICYIYFPDWLTRTIRLGEGAGYAWFNIEDALNLKGLHPEAHGILLEFKNKVLNS